MAGKVSAGREGVLEGNTGRGSDGALCLLVCKFLDESCQVEGLKEDIRVSERLMG